MRRTILPLAGGYLSLRGAVEATRLVFGNLEQRATSTMSVAALLGAQIEGIADPMERFALASAAADRHFTALARDAARLPGEVKDFTQAAQLALTPVVAGLGDTTIGAALEKTRELAANLSIVRTAFGIDANTAASQLQMMLSGGAGREQLLFRMLQPFGLPQTEALNAAPAAERLRLVDEALGNIARNPAVRDKVFDLLDTQLGTLKDTIFGTTGILGQLGVEPYKMFVDGLKDLNAELAEASPKIVSNFGAISDVFAVLGQAKLPGWIAAIADFYGEERRAARREWLSSSRFGVWLSGKGIEMEDFGPDRAAIRGMVATFNALTQGTKPSAEYRKLLGLEHMRENLRYQEQASALALQLGFGGDRTQAEDTKLSAPERPVNVVNHWTIKLDLKSDDSPEAIAVKIRRAAEKTARHPTMTTRGLPTTPGSSALGGP
jgi:hypothetical protein